MSQEEAAQARSTEERLAIELARVLEPLDTAVHGGTEGVVDLLDQVGLGEDLLDSEFETIQWTIEDEAEPALKTLRDQLFDPIRSGEDISFGALDYKTLIGAVSDVYTNVKRLQDLEFTHVDADEVANHIFDFLLVKYLSTYRRSVHDMLCLAGVIEEGVPPAVDLSKLPEFLRDPNRVAAAAFGWGEETFTGFLVLYYLREIFWQFQIPAVLQEPPKSMVEDLTGTNVELNDIEQELQVPVLSVLEESGAATVGIRIVPLPGSSDNDLPGMAVVPYGLADASETLDLGDGWTFNVDVNAEQTDWGIGIWPNTDGPGSHAEVIGSDKPVPDFNAIAALEYSGSSEKYNETMLFGKPTGSRLAVRYAELNASVRIEDEQFIFEVALPTRGTLAIKTDQLDSFLESILPRDGLLYDFDVTVGWSSTRGFFFKRGSGLEVSLPQNRRIGAIRLTELYLGIIPDEDTDEVKIDGLASANVELGPVTGTITRVGITADVGFPEDRNGNLGPVDLNIGVKPPDGIAVSADAEVVTGGGFLDYDPENERYAGVVTLKFGELTINAIGLLSTEVPGDNADYSLLLIIAGEFTPIRLGLGFTLNGIGGIVGLHRSVKSEPLGEVVRNGSLDSVLFPKDPVANADRIRSDLREIFPVTPDTHVFGPIVRLEWGTPTMLTADLGVVFELPSWKLAALGNFQAILPDEDAGLLTLNMAAAGIIDPGEERIDVDAGLYDSRLMNWTLTGNMALRTRRGDDPRFVLSVGGFNPRFEPPSSVPPLDRVKATLGPARGNPKLEYAGYFAITSNTLQAGAGVQVVATAGPATVEGNLSFDALIEFNPFGFVADFHASVSVAVKGKGFSISLDGTISGPGPIRVQGKIKISMFLFSISAKLDVKLGSGESTELPSAQIMPALEQELSRPENWEAQLPRSGEGFAVLREVDRDEDEVIAHPLATLGVRQTVVPLDFEIEKYGEVTPTDYTHFSLGDATVADSILELAAESTEHFAPAQYTNMSDSERIDSPAFERHPAGRKLRDTGTYLGYDDDNARKENIRETSLTYTSIVFDQANERNGIPLEFLGGFIDSLSGFDAGVVPALEDVGAVADSPVRRAGSRRFHLSEIDKLEDQALTDGRPISRITDEGVEELHRGGANPDVGGLGGQITMSDDRYVVVEAGSLNPVDIPTAPNQRMSKATAKRALARYRSQNPAHARALRVVNASTVDASETLMEGIQ